MSLVLVRVDCRLIHGQILETWVPHVGADAIIVANDDLADNPFLRSVMEIAVPSSIHAVFGRVDDAGALVLEVNALGEKAILLCATLGDALKILDEGVPFGSLNIGNLHYSAGKVEVAPSVFFSRGDFEAVERFVGRGVEVHVRATPFEAQRPFDGRRKG